MNKFKYIEYEKDGIKHSVLTATGHTGYKTTSKGTELLCCAVSTILQVACLGLDRYGINVTATKDNKKGSMTIDVIRKDCDISDAEVQAIFVTALLGLKQLAKQYPKYIKEDK